eukprot:Hpha_TRINITY_DN12163_c0_g1::TRINITY_DN12163_c0_g1_i1::g.82112::m.82112/K00905/BCKDK; [3-methyl-2-oxobutanoate dehydrogenase (acetyl-transferring)] kinase
MLGRFSFAARPRLSRCCAAFSTAAAEHVHKLDFYDRTVEEYAKETPTHVSLRYCLEFSKEPDQEKCMTMSRFLARELPVRIAHTIRRFQALPYIVVRNPSIERIYSSHLQSFQMLTAMPKIENWEQHTAFCKFVAERLSIHANVISDLSRGIKDVRVLPESVAPDFTSLDRFLDQLLVNRISRRLLAEVLLMMHKQTVDPSSAPPAEERSGVFTMNLRAADVVENCLSQVTYLAEETYGYAPEFLVKGDVDATFPFVASHLEYIMFELCKNAVRATIEHHPENDGVDLPPVEVRICKGKDITLVISDQGGGLAKEAERNVGSYGFSTARPTDRDNECYTVKYGTHEDAPEQIQFAGFGFGLPLSRIYSMYHGGGLAYQSMPGFGSDFYLRLPTEVPYSLLPWEDRAVLGKFEDHHNLA